MQERRIEDYWNIDGSRDLSYSWTGFTQFTLLEEKPPDGCMWSGRRLTKRQVTSRPDHLWPELCIKLGRNAKLKEWQKWSNEKPKLDNARRLRGIYFIYPEDKEFKETIKNIARNWKHQRLLHCLERQARRVSMVRPVVRRMISNQNLRVSWKPVNRQDCVWKNLHRIIMRTILQEKKRQFTATLQFGTQIYSYASRHEKFPQHGRTCSAWNLTKVRSKSQVIDEAKTKGAKVHFASLMDICHLESAELEAEHQK